jgi:hypothetical protein
MDNENIIIIKNLLNEINNLMMLQTLNAGTQKGYELCNEIRETTIHIKKKIIDLYPKSENYISNIFDRTFDSVDSRWRMINSVEVSKIIVEQFKW